MLRTTRLAIFSAALIVAVQPAIAIAQDGPPPGVPSQSSTSRPVSPTVFATTMVTTIDGATSLNLLVLFRGSPGWFTKPGPQGGKSGMNGSGSYVSWQHGGLAYTVELQREPRAVRIQGKEVRLDPADANVILVDQVDGEMKVVGTLKVTPAMTPDKRLEPLLKQSPQLVSFLQCDQKPQEPQLQGLLGLTCQGLIGK